MVTTKTEPPKHGATKICMLVKTSQPRLATGYLLLEVTLAIAISAIILTTVFKIADWNLRVTNDAVESSNEHMKQAAFFSFLDRAFLKLSGDARVELNFTETSTAYLSELIIQDAGEVFSWPNQPFTASAVKLVTKPNRNKTIDILLEYYADPLISTGNNTLEEVNPDQEPLQTLILLDDIWRFEWRVWDGQTINREREPMWEGEWRDTGLPRYFELNTIFTPEEKASVHVFWNPQKVDPAKHFQNFLNQRNAAQRTNQTGNAEDTRQTPSDQTTPPSGRRMTSGGSSIIR